MKLFEMRCPNCEASLKINPETKECFCEYCDSRFILEDEKLMSYEEYSNTHNYTYGNQQSYTGNDNTGYPRYDNPPYTPEPRKKRRTWLWVLGWIFCFPIPATILINRKKDWNPAVRIILIVFLWLLYIGWMGNSSDSGSSSRQIIKEYSQSSMIISRQETEKAEEAEITEISFRKTTGKTDRYVIVCDTSIFQLT